MGVERYPPPPVSSSIDPERAPLRQALGSHLARVQDQVAAAADASGRTPPGIVAVTKAVSAEVCAAWVELGHRDLGENRVPALVEKAERLGAMGLEPRWHFIGHLQRNKARKALAVCHVLHSVDSERLAETVVHLADELERPVEAFVEVNLTGEAEKHGCAPAEVEAIAALLDASAFLSVRGLMAMGPLDTRAGARTTAEVFGEARDLADDLTARLPHLFAGGRCALSMGMSGDLAEAIAAGTDLVRIGSALHADLPPRAPAGPRTSDR